MNNPDSHEAVLTVTQLNRLAKQVLEECFDTVTVSGEISNLAQPSSGHWYFTLKDARAQIRCAMFKNRNRLCRFQPKAGDEVQVRGRVSLYEGRGDYQLIADAIQPAGSGALAAAFEKLKQDLRAAGWFDEAAKKPLPEKIRHIAVISSKTGAAIQDVLSVLERRWPLMGITLLPSLVQGDGAAETLAKAIRSANRAAADNGFDVILLTRGGGSLEDLWAFNEMPVAQAIRDSTLPVVSAVGHEIDFTIADFVADVRAATPSAAAELLSPDQEQIRVWLTSLMHRMHSLQVQDIAAKRTAVQQLSKRLRDPRRELSDRSQRLDQLEMRLRNAQQRRVKQLARELAIYAQRIGRCRPDIQLSAKRRELERLELRLAPLIARKLAASTQAQNALHARLKTLGPEQTLERGYAIVSDGAGKILRDANNVERNQPITARLAKGRVIARVEDVVVD